MSYQFILRFTDLSVYSVILQQLPVHNPSTFHVQESYLHIVKKRIVYAYLINKLILL